MESIRQVYRTAAGRQVSYFGLAAVLALLAAFSSCPVQAAGWTTYRGNITRSGEIPQTVKPDISLCWMFKPSHAPRPAWPKPSEEMPRMHNDNAYHVVIANGRAYWATSVTDKVYAVDIDSGKVLWSFNAEGPIRFAPTVYKGRVFVGSDDGYVYCLDAGKGELLWKYRPGPDEEKVIGNGRMISIWPVRTGVLVDKGVVYCGAGVFPYEGIYLCALRVADGKVIWKNDTVGDEAHELDYGGISPQGYLVASEKVLYVPSGRAMPAAFDRQTGKFLFYASTNGKRGGTWALLDNNQLIAGVDQSGTPEKYAYDANSGKNEGDVFAWFPGVDMVVNDHHSYLLTLRGIYAIDRRQFSRAEQKVNSLASQQKSMERDLGKLKKDIKKASGKDKAALQKKIDELASKIASLVLEQKKGREHSFEWFYSGEDFHSLILTGEMLYVGGKGKIVGINVNSGRELWRAKIEGTAVSMAGDGENLLVSTSQGPIYCFTPGEHQTVNTIAPAQENNPYGDGKQAVFYRQTAEKIIADSGVDKGYALVVECNKGQLAYELARRTKLYIIGIESDPVKRSIARRKLERAGLWGTRVVVEDWNMEDLPPYFANLITADGLLSSGKANVTRQQLRRVLRPFGGTVLAAMPDKDYGGLKWFKYVRPELEGVGSWTQQYGNPQNTACSHDELVKGPLGMLWYGEPGSQLMVERHAKAQSPLVMNGRMFVQGEEVVMAYDAFNGSKLWQRKIPGAVRARVDVDGGNLALGEDSLYVAANDICYRIDQESGEIVRKYKLPPTADGSKRRWGYVSCVGQKLIGVRAMPLKAAYGAKLRADYPQPDEAVKWAYKRSNALWYPMADYPLWENYNSAGGSVTARMMCGDSVFAVDTETGKLLWQYSGKRIANISVSIGDGKVFFADSGIVSAAQRKKALEERKQLIARQVYYPTDAMKKQGDKYQPADVRLAVALDINSGREIWSRPIDFTGCCGDAMGSAVQDDVLLFFGNVGNHDAYRFQQGQLKFRRIVAVSASKGNILWSKPINYRTRPVIIDKTIIIEPRACDLYTGQIKQRRDPFTGRENTWEFLRPGHTCAVSSASANALFYRSECFAMYDLEEDSGVALFGGIRPGCWITTIPASGLVVAPESSSGCTCSFPLRCSFVLVPKPDKSYPWTVYIDQTLMDKKGKVIPYTYGKPVRHLAINLGAPGDRKDNRGTLWLGYPNPKTVYLGNHFNNYGVKFDLQETILPGEGYYKTDFRGKNIAGTDLPWLFTSGCEGLIKCRIPLIAKNQQPAKYTVRLGFIAPANDTRGQRVFDIKLQGKVVAEKFDILQAAGWANCAVVKSFTSVPVADDLLLELVPSGDNRAGKVPVINCIEIIREEGS